MLRRHLLPLAVLLGALLPAHAQIPPGPVNPQAPTLNPILPLGGQRGTTLDLTLTGTKLDGSTGLWTSFPAKVTIPTDGDNGKNPAQLRVKLEVPADAPLGFHAIRLATRKGMSNARIFCIDDLTTVNALPTNHAPKTPQQVPIPCVVTGRIDAEVTDYYKVSVKAGQHLSFEVLGRRLGSAFDPELTILTADGKEVPGGYSNDAPGLQTDARISHTFKMAGDYLIAVRDFAYKGGPDYHYRLRIGDFPCATTPLPLAVKRGIKTSVSFTGSHLEGVSSVEISAPTDPAIQAIQVAPSGPSGLHGWPVMLALSDLDEVVEKEPNDTIDKATQVPVPGAVSGRFQAKDDVDHFAIKLLKGKKYILDAQTAEYNSPSEVRILVKDGKGAELAASNDMGAPRLEFTPPADGDYFLVVGPLTPSGGPDECYRVTITLAEPDFELILNMDRFDAAPDGTFSVPVFLTRAGYDGPVEVGVLGKELSGSLTIPAGPKPANVPAGTLSVHVGNLPSGPVTFHVVGKASINGHTVSHIASDRTVVSTALGSIPVPPRTFLDVLGLSVTDRAPFTLTAKVGEPVVMPGKPVVFTVSATRTGDFKSEITLTFVGLPKGVEAPPKKIAANSSEVKVELKLPTLKTPLQVTVRGTAKHEGKDVAASTPPVTLAPMPKK
jgi:hypothetical protein